MINDFLFGLLSHIQNLTTVISRNAKSAIQSLRIQSKASGIKNSLGKITIRKDPCTPKFIAALFTIAKTWKQPKCPLTEE